MILSKYKLIKTNDIYKLVDTTVASNTRYKEAQALLYEYYNKGLNTSVIQPILEQLKDDYYFFLLGAIYKHKSVIEWLANENHMDISTLKRNKKRLTMIIYDLWEEADKNESGIV